MTELEADQVTVDALYEFRVYRNRREFQQAKALILKHWKHLPVEHARRLADYYMFDRGAMQRPAGLTVAPWAGIEDFERFVRRPDPRILTGFEETLEPGSFARFLLALETRVCAGLRTAAAVAEFTAELRRRKLIRGPHAKK